MFQDDKCRKFFEDRVGAGKFSDWVNDIMLVSGSANFSQNNTLNNQASSDLAHHGVNLVGYVILYAQNSAFFNKTGAGGLPSQYYSVTSLNAGSDRLRVMTMLHELGHAANLLESDNASVTSRQAASARNNDKIWENCQETVKAFKN